MDHKGAAIFNGLPGDPQTGRSSAYWSVTESLAENAYKPTNRLEYNRPRKSVRWRPACREPEVLPGGSPHV